MFERPESSGSTDATAPPARPRRVNTIVLIVVLICVAALVIGFVLLRSPDGSTDGETGERTEIARFSGDGNQVTERFEVTEGWQVHWETRGRGFRFSIDGDEFDYGTVIKEKRPGSGVTSPVGEGTFRIEVKAKGPWSIRIIQGEPPEEKSE